MNDLPLWLKALSACTGILIGIGAVLWAVFIVWPYMKVTRRAMLRSLELGVQSTEILRRLSNDIDPMLSDLRAVLDDIKKADVGRVADAMAKSGVLDRLAGSTEKLAAKFHELAEKAKKEAVDNLIERL